MEATTGHLLPDSQIGKPRDATGYTAPYSLWADDAGNGGNSVLLWPTPQPLRGAARRDPEVNPMRVNIRLEAKVKLDVAATLRAVAAIIWLLL